MRLKYLGTAAAEGIPGMFCTCAVCETARRLGGRDIRTRSQALADGRLLIDFPPDTYLHALHGGLDLPGISACLITHAHSDHLCPGELEYRIPGYAYKGAVGAYHREPLRVYATARAMEHIRAANIDGLESAGAVTLHEIRPFEPFSVDDFTVTALTADHAPETGPVCYIIERGGSAMLYAHDTGWFPEETWSCLARLPTRLRFVSMDCTEAAAGDYRNGHMCLAVNAQLRDRLLSLGRADAETVFCANHFSHNGRLNHAELVQAAAKYDFLVSYDGMEVSF
ncbi:MAG: MBL fold metallo-hydrolase [Oscillospiraceae bacterium]|nr:MBL fold metallo-hydrolase [Oscillospiraceae bacterium]